MVKKTAEPMDAAFRMDVFQAIQDVQESRVTLFSIYIFQLSFQFGIPLSNPVGECWTTYFHLNKEDQLSVRVQR